MLERQAKAAKEREAELKHGQEVIEDDARQLDKIKYKEVLHKKKTQDYWWLQYQNTSTVKQKLDAEKIREKEVEAVEAFRRS